MTRQALIGLVVSIFKARLFKRLILSKLQRSKRNYLKSLQLSIRHFIVHLEHEGADRQAAGGLTTALANLPKAIFVEVLLGSGCCCLSALQ